MEQRHNEAQSTQHHRSQHHSTTASQHHVASRLATVACIPFPHCALRSAKLLIYLRKCYLSYGTTERNRTGEKRTEAIKI